jgi:hypothetical protein
MLFLIPQIVVIVLVRGWALMLLWGWFVRPTFEQLPRITLVQAAGLMLICELLTDRLARTMKEGPGEEISKSRAIQFLVFLLMEVLGPLLMVATGWVLRFLG